MDYEEMSKDSLVNKLYVRDDTISELEDKIKDLEEEIDELDTQLEDLEIKNGIKDTNNFIWKLKVDGLHSDKLEEFIKNYLKYYNN